MKLYTRILLKFTLIFVAISDVTAQKEASHWYFGGGIDFTTNPPSADNNGRVILGEGCSSISDENGNLLFYNLQSYYYDTIFNKNHLLMSNGDGIIGYSSSVQSSIIVKKPGSNHIYYIFEQSSSEGLRYSEIDMNMSAGNGSVTAKNIPVYLDSTLIQAEQVTAVRHCNGIDIWVITRDLTPSQFRCNLITSAGINLTPVLSPDGLFAVQGQMKASPNGRKIAYVSTDSGSSIFDFDPSTGIVSNPLNLNAYAYGCEFSPDGTKFYASAFSIIHQWDLCAGSDLAIINSSYTAASSIPNKTYGSLQNGPDGKIYVATGVSNSICVIANPNVYGVGCNFQPLAQYVGTNSCQSALPNFLTSYFKQLPSPYTYTTACQTVSVSSPVYSTLTPACSYAALPYTGVTWDFGDPPSGIANTSSLTFATHTYPSSGTYTVKLVLHTACGADTLRKIINVGIATSGNTMICLGANVNLTASGASNYSWSSGATGNSINVQPVSTTTYIVTGTISPNCVTTNSIVVKVNVCTGIGELIGPNTSRIYPNPNKGWFNIEVTEELTFEVWTTIGSIVKKGILVPGISQLDIQGLDNGIYLVRLSNGNYQRFVKIIKQ